MTEVPQYQTAEELREYRREYRTRPHVQKKHKLAVLQWKMENPERVKKIQLRYRLKRKYGISILDREEALCKQHNRCAICRSSFNKIKGKSIHVDHCHRTGLFRGLLCNRCNLGIGLFKESFVLLRAAVLYLEEHK